MLLPPRPDLHVHSVRVVYCDDPGACFTYDGEEVTANFKRNEVRRQPELLQPPATHPVNHRNGDGGRRGGARDREGEKALRRVVKNRP